jgi:HEAT repeat protein
MVGNTRPAEARPAVPALGQALKDDDVTVRLYAAQALYAADRHSELVVPVFQEALHHPNPALRTAAAQALAGIGPAAKDATRDLDKALAGERDGDVRLALGEALWFVDGQADPLLTVLGEALRDPDPDRRGAAADLVGQVGDKLGPGAADLVDGLVKALRGDGPALVRARAAQALGRLGPEARAAAPALGEALDDADSSVRHSAAFALGRLGRGAEAAVPALVATLRKKEDGLLRARAAAALEAFGPAAAAAVGPLVEALKDPENKALRARAAAALGADRRQRPGRGGGPEQSADRPRQGGARLRRPGPVGARPPGPCGDPDPVRPAPQCRRRSAPVRRPGPGQDGPGRQGGLPGPARCRQRPGRPRPRGG